MGDPPNLVPVQQQGNPRGAGVARRGLECFMYVGEDHDALFRWDNDLKVMMEAVVVYRPPQARLRGKVQQRSGFEVGHSSLIDHRMSPDKLTDLADWVATSLKQATVCGLTRSDPPHLACACQQQGHVTVGRGADDNA